MRCDATFHPSWFHRHAGVSFGRRFHADAAYRVEADRSMRRALWERFPELPLGERDPAPRPVLWTDLLASGYLFSAMSGCDIRFYDDAPPEVQCARMDETAVGRLSVEDALATGWWRDTLAQCAYLESAYGRVLPCVNLQGVQNIALDLRGEALFFDYADDPALADRLLSFCAALMARCGGALRRLSPNVSHGVTGVLRYVAPDVYLHSNCTVEMISLAVYERFLLPHDVTLSRMFTPYGVHHCGQTMEHVAAVYAKIPGLAFAEVGAGSDVAAVRAALGGDVFLNVRYSPARLLTVEPEALSHEVLALLEAAKPEGRRSLSCVGIDASMPDAQVRRLFAAAEEALR